MALTLRARLLNHYRYLVQRLLPGRNALDDQKRLLGAAGASVIFDVGAHVGQTAYAYRKLFPKATIYAFEPYEPAFKILQASHRRDPGVRPVPLGLAEEAGTRPFHVNQASANSSILAPSPAVAAYFDPEFTATKEQREIAVTTVDQFMRERQVSQIDLLKLDVQGAELLVLQGARAALEARSVRLIYTEVEFVPLYQHQALFGDVLSYLTTAGYVFYNLYNLYYGLNGQLVAADAIFARPELIPGAPPEGVAA